MTSYNDVPIQGLNYFTDGSASTKTKCGGWACLVSEDGNVTNIIKGGEPDTTNNRMELKGFLAALQDASKHPNIKFSINCDSAYIVNCFQDRWYEKWLRNNWRASDKQPVKNQDLWKEILELFFALRSYITINKVESHKDNILNNYADLVAVKARQEEEVKLQKEEILNGRM